MRQFVVVLFICSLVHSCAYEVDKHSQSRVEEYCEVEFCLPQVPVMLTNPIDRARYLANNFWSNYDLNDSLFVHNDSLRQLVVGGYIKILEINDSATVASSVAAVLEDALKVNHPTFELLTNTFEYHLYSPNSPLRNEYLYAFVLRHVVNEAQLESIYKVRAKCQLESIMKNRVGDKAADIVFYDANDKQYTLYSLKAEHVLLFFNNPDCSDCDRVKSYISKSDILNSAYKQGRLAVVTICVDGTYAHWKETQYPEFVINVYDKNNSIDSNGSYDLQALPTLYLLDRDKKVLQKDTMIEEIAAYFLTAN